MKNLIKKLSIVLGIFISTLSICAESGDVEMDVNKNIVETKKVSFDFKEKVVMLNSGYKMPLNGIGTYSLLKDPCVDSVSFALQKGYRLIDTAYIYENEESVGEAIKKSRIPREEIFITTKLYMNQYSNAENAINEALKKLNVDYIDLMLLHHPGVHDVEAYKAMEKAKKMEKFVQ